MFTYKKDLLHERINSKLSFYQYHIRSQLLANRRIVEEKSSGEIIEKTEELTLGDKLGSAI